MEFNDFIYDAFFEHLQEEAQQATDCVDEDLLAAESMYESLSKNPYQQYLIDDPSTRKAALCPRRSGKSWAAMAYAHIVCLKQPNARVVIATLTLKTAKNIYWWEMEAFARHYGLNLDRNLNELRVDFPNGSKIMLIGAESKAQVDKLRGGKYNLIIIDECKSFPEIILTELIREVMEPALDDYKGTLLLIGTPGNLLAGPFYEATFPGLIDDREDSNLRGQPFSRCYANPEPYWKRTKGTEPRWSRHTWSRQDNVFIPHLWAESLKRKAREGWDDDHPTWLREYLGHWVPADSAYVYALNAMIRKDKDRCLWYPDLKSNEKFGLPPGNWHYVLGLDLGFEDDTALCIVAYNDLDPILYHCWEMKKPHLDVDQVGTWVEHARSLVDGQFDAIVGDFGGGGKQIIETFRRRYGINIIAAEKTQKFDYIELLNADYLSGRIRIMKNSDLYHEKCMLTWDLSKASKEMLAKTGKLREAPELPNHLCDAFLYTWRYCYHFFAKRFDAGPPIGSDAWVSLTTRQAIEGLVKARNANQDGLFAGVDTGIDLGRDYDFWSRLG